MSVRSQRLIGPTAVTATNLTTLYTVPSGRTLILRTLFVRNQHASATSGRYRVEILGSGETIGSDVFWRTALPPDSSVTVEGWWVARPGDVINGWNPDSSVPTLYFGLWGSLLNGEPT